MTPEDHLEAYKLAPAVVWNQTKEDWQRLFDLYPENCFGGYVDGELVATSTLATYENRLAYVGMVLVAPDHRR
ncbi:GNAT family N-acetyltransferase [Haloplanus salilacus]|uniref:GNAT family N-acetyltransferase n=1 Tax=Haloplanus salilacus TaxID=2949994 RepID=UPI0030D0CFAF